MEEKGLSILFYSQYGEDRRLATIFPGNEGVCVEVGALDGITHSNTLHFEARGWQCILVEANPHLCSSIRRSRSAQLFSCGASDQVGQATLEICEDRPALSTFGTMDQPDGGHVSSISVPTRTMDSMLAECDVERVDFVSIDVEGHELSVLRGLTLSRWNPRVVIIEDLSEFGAAAVPAHMKSQGYVRLLRTGCNDWYARRTDRELFTWRSNGNLLYWRIRICVRRMLPGSVLPMARRIFWLLAGKP